MSKPECSACLKEVNGKEFLREGGLCKQCSKQIDKINKEEGIDGIRRFWSKRRAEAAKRIR